MALINCRECKKEISNSVNKCPQCGIKTPDEKKYNSAIRALKLLSIIPAFALLMIIGSIFSANNEVLIDKNIYSSPSSDFVENNPELGELVFPYIENSADWAQGKRQWVTTDKGKYLFYLKDNEVVTVYLSDERADQGKREIWRKPQNDNSSIVPTSAQDDVKSDGQTTVQWSLYQPKLKQDIDKMFEEKNCDSLKKVFDYAFEIQQSGAARNPHVSLVAYVVEKRFDADCHD